mgnify:FL=1
MLPEKPVLSIQMLEDRYALENHLLDAGEITTEQQEQSLVVEMLQQYCDRVTRYSPPAIRWSSAISSTITTCI